MTAPRNLRFRVPEQLLLPWSPQATISTVRAAEMLDCDKSTVIRLIEQRLISAYQLRPGVAGSPWRINYDSVLKYLAQIHEEAGVERRFDL